MRNTFNRRLLMPILLSLMMLLPGCIGGDEGDEGIEPLREMPDFESLADDGATYSKSNLMGQGYIVLFSAEWCNAPCHNVMHKIYNNLEGATVLVMSTDPNTDITLEEWHEDADDYDDTDDDTGVDLPYAFMKGVEVSQELGIDARPTLIFVNNDGGVMAEHEGAVDSIDDLKAMYDLID
jgi:hypothetical protein